MRALTAIAILAFAVTGATGAAAADLRVGRIAHYTYYPAVGLRAAPLIVYDDEPGVIERAYWLPPARNRHYFPFGRDRWDRRKIHTYVRPKPAQSYHRYWSTSQLDRRELPRLGARPTVAPSGAQRPIFEK